MATIPQSIPGKKNKVGIFMPYYNMEDFIDEALESLYAQTFTDFFVIIADDNSPSSKARPKLSTIKHPAIHIYYEKKNLGLIKISNKYMSKLDTEYIMLFSPDDKMDPDFLREQVEYLDSHKNIHAVCTWIQEFGDGNKLIQYSDNTCKLPDMLVSNNFSGAALMRKSAWLAAGKHDTNKDLYPNLDYDLWLSMLQKGFTLGTIAKPLFYWRVVRDSLSHGVDANRTLIFRKALIKKYANLYENNYSYVLNYYLELISKFEDYYVSSEEGHEWLDNQYKNLISENSRLNTEIYNTIQFPHPRRLFNKLKNLRKSK